MELPEGASPPASHKEIAAPSFGLNPQFTFDRIIIGSSNRATYNSCQKILENPGNLYNPLFIYGGVGLGKEQLLHATGNQALRLYPHLSVRFISSESFASSVQSKDSSQHLEDIRQEYTNLDFLILDDIQFLAGKELVQEVFFQIVDELLKTNRQVILSADRPPQALLVFPAKIRSQLAGGLITYIKMPDYEMRLTILRARANSYPGLPVPFEVIEFIAQKIISNIRELESALSQVINFSLTHQQPLTVGLASQVLNEKMLNSRKKTVTKEQIMETVATYFKIETSTLAGKFQNAEIALPRQIAMYISREQTEDSLAEIGRFFGGRNPSTVIYSLNKIEDALEKDSKLRGVVNTITQMVYNAREW